MAGLTGVAGLVRERLTGVRGLLRVAVTGGLRSGGGLLVRLSGLRRHSLGGLRRREALGQRRERLVGVGLGLRLLRGLAGGLGLRRHGGLAGRLRLGLRCLGRGRLYGTSGRGGGGLRLGLCVRLRFRGGRGIVLGRGLSGGVGVGLDVVLRLVDLREGCGSGGVGRLHLVAPLLVRLYVVVGIAEQARGLGVGGGMVELGLRLSHGLRHRLCGCGLLGRGRHRDAGCRGGRRGRSALSVGVDRTQHGEAGGAGGGAGVCCWGAVGGWAGVWD
ncbi:hypothetical protein ACQF36_04475 [Streptomyces sp. Marseille-Q5077]|uniref:hypothetical protein n=1 Tax=Streptomyces sp. Marseille-Q5077 TaxID=3418995 RepID=UPI003D060EAD